MFRLAHFDPRSFLQQSWQRRPQLFRQAFTNFSSPISGEELAHLAGEEYAEARLVLGPDPHDNYCLEHGPFDRRRFAQLPVDNWTLLVQDVDKWSADVEAVMVPFRQFIPTWRLNDIMVSYAVPGGSVGAHYDHYDVFLLQAQGRRQWRLDSSPSPDLAYRDDQELRLLKQFRPNRDWTLEPGDMLYLPPGVPHHGIALDAGLTFSIGMRAPSQQELLFGFCEDVAANLTEGDRYGDPDPTWPELGGALPDSLIDQLGEMIGRLTATEPTDLARWFGRFITNYQMSDEPATPDGSLSIAQLRAAAETNGLTRNPWTRCVYRRHDDEKAWLFVCGSEYPTSLRAARILCDEPQVDGPTLSGLLSEDRGLILDLCRQGYWAPT